MAILISSLSSGHRFPGPGNRAAVLSRCIMAAVLLALTAEGYAQKDHYSEYEVKAAFLYQFISFVEWPSDAFEDDAADFAIGILGEDPFNGILDNIVKGKKAHNRSIGIIRSQDPEALKSCQIVFVSSSEQANSKQVMDTLSGSSILTIGEWDMFTQEGGIIRFMVQKNKIAFEINNDQAQEVGLKISSQLLKLAQAGDDKEGRSS
jgi:hypothetical protein